MALLEIIRVPDPRLSESSRALQEVEFGAALQERLDDMAETMYAAPGIGLAAVQVADLRRMLVADVGLKKDADGERIHELVQLVNPEIVDVANELITWEEGCLSVPGFYEAVTRASHIHVKALSRDGDPISIEAEDLLAVCIQHEIDHLDGKLFVDYLSAAKRQMIRKKLLKLQRQQA